MDIFGGFIFLFILVLLILVIVIMIQRFSSSRYHEAGEAADERNLGDFGVPAKTLYTSSKILTLHNQIDITDENEKPVYQSMSKVLSLHDRTQINRTDGTLVANMHRPFFTLHERHFIEMANGKSFTIASELWHIARHIIHIEELGWTINGHILEMNYYISDEKENVVAVVGEKKISLHDKFCIDIYQPEYEEEVIAILITLIHMLQDRRRASSGSAGSSSSSSN